MTLDDQNLACCSCSENHHNTAGCRILKEKCIIYRLQYDYAKHCIAKETLMHIWSFKVLSSFTWAACVVILTLWAQFLWSNSFILNKRLSKPALSKQKPHELNWEIYENNMDSQQPRGLQKNLLVPGLKWPRLENLEEEDTFQKNTIWKYRYANRNLIFLFCSHICWE